MNRPRSDLDKKKRPGRGVGLTTFVVRGGTSILGWYCLFVNLQHIARVMIVQRVSFYIDGFNLYYGLRSKGWRRYYWLDLCQLARNLLLPDQRLAAVRYFTSPVLPQPDNPGQRERQRTYLEALATLPHLSIHYGYFLAKDYTCPVCGAGRVNVSKRR